MPITYPRWLVRWQIFLFKSDVDSRLHSNPLYCSANQKLRYPRSYSLDQWTRVHLRNIKVRKLRLSRLYRDVRPITSTTTATPANFLQAESLPLEARAFLSRFGTCAVHKGKSRTGMEQLDRRRTGQDHGAFRELGGSANTAKAYCPAGSCGMRRMLQSPPRLVLLSGQRRTGRP